MNFCTKKSAKKLKFLDRHIKVKSDQTVVQRQQLVAAKAGLDTQHENKNQNNFKKFLKFNVFIKIIKTDKTDSNLEVALTVRRCAGVRTRAVGKWSGEDDRGAGSYHLHRRVRAGPEKSASPHGLPATLPGNTIRRHRRLLVVRERRTEGGKLPHMYAVYVTSS